MDNMCSDSQSLKNEESKECKNIQKDDNSERKSVFKFTSPVFRNFTQPINRCKRYDSTSEDDFVSNKINQTQTAKSSRKSFNEGKSEYDNICPLNLNSSPLFSSVERGRSTEIQTIGSLLKGDYFELHLKNNWPPHPVSSEKKLRNPFEALGMDEKDISWASSMASPPPDIIPSEELNTKEKETLLPEEGFRNVQPRALFSPNSTDDDCGCKPLKISSDSELSEGYETNMRLSDVCQTLKDMNVKSLESTKGNSLNETDVTLVNDATLQRSQSPVIITRRKRKNIKKKGMLVMSPVAVKKYKDTLISENSKSDEQSNLLPDDSFQNLPFSQIDDEIFKNSLINDSRQDEQTLVPISGGKKFFYESASKNNEIVETVSDLECFLNSASLLEAADVGKSHKFLKSLGNVNKGLVPFKNLVNNENSISTKRLRSEIVSDDKSCEKKKFKIEDESKNESEWESYTRDNFGSDDDTTESQILRAFENVEKVKENEETRNLSPINEEPAQEDKKMIFCQTKEETGETELIKFGGFSTAGGKNVVVSTDAIKKVETMFLKNEKKYKEDTEKKNSSTREEPSETELLKFFGFSSARERNTTEFAGAPEEIESVFAENKRTCGEDTEQKSSCPTNEEPSQTESIKVVGFTTARGKNVSASAEALKKVESMFAINEKKFIESKKNEDANNCGFAGASGSRPKIPNKPLKVPKNIFEDIDFSDLMPFQNKINSGGFKAVGGKKTDVTSEPFHKAKNINNNNDQVDGCSEINKNFVTSVKDLLGNCDKQMELFNEMNQNVSNIDAPVGFKTCSGKPINISENLISKAKTLLEPEKLSESDEIIPPWLHAYSTSPSFCLKQNEKQAFISQEDGSKKVAEPFVITSPVLGSSDRFIKKGKKISRKLDFKASVEPIFTASSQKRDSSNLTIDFSAPFKKPKFEENVIDDKVTSESIIEARKFARLEQRKLAEKKNVKPVKGKHLTRKKSEPQTPLIEFVNNEFPQHYSKDELIELGVKDYVIDVNIENAGEFRFKSDYFGTDCCGNVNGIAIGDECYLILDDNNEAGVEEFTDAFFASPGVESSLISKEWVSNHYKWIVWKFAHYETSFPKQFGGQCLTPDNLMLQLKYRYDREVDHNERSALKKILERDDSSAKRLVLCVCKIKKVISTIDHENSANFNTYHLSVTDGWYSCNVHVDSAVVPLIENGKITVGTKLVTYGAELVNGGQGVSPLEASDDVYLKISTNSTRRIRWDAKLGFQKNPGPMPVSLNSVLPQGGIISRVDVIIVRTYPIVYVEKQADGRRVTRNRRLEDKAAAAFEKEQEKRIEKIYSDVQAEFQKKNNKKSVKCDEEELCDYLEGGDSSALHLSVEQANSLMKFRDLQNQEMSRILQEKLQAEKINKRDVSELLKVKIVDLRNPDYSKFGILSLWRPSEDVVGFFMEGKAVSLLNVSPSNYKGFIKNIQLNTTRQSKYLEISRQAKYPSRSLTRICDISAELEYCFDEIDIVGLVVYIHDASFKSGSLQTVYLTDNGVDFVGVTFWGSSADFGWDNVLKIKSVVACSNLQLKKSSMAKSIPCVNANENTVFTENPRQQHLIHGIENVKKIFNQDIDDLIAKCQEEITSKLDNSYHHVSKNVSNCSDLSVNDGSVNKPKFLSALAMRPNASSTPLKSKKIGADLVDFEPSPIQKKLDYLRAFPEPPPISPLIPENCLKKVSTKFKVPFKQSSNDTTPMES